MSAPETDDSVARTTRRGSIAILAFWVAMLGLLYMGFSYVEQRQQAAYVAHVGEQGELVIPRGRDGHFRVAGEVNGQAVMFLVDTGASSVAVSEAFAQKAGLSGGVAITLQTANGTLPGRMLRNVPVRASHLGSVPAVVAVGLVGLDEDEALLGQSFLSRFDIQIVQNEMRLTPRS
jgi:aspartyl protease family protein